MSHAWFRRTRIKLTGFMFGNTMSDGTFAIGFYNGRRRLSKAGLLALDRNEARLLRDGLDNKLYEKLDALTYVERLANITVSHYVLEEIRTHCSSWHDTVGSVGVIRDIFLEEAEQVDSGLIRLAAKMVEKLDDDIGPIIFTE